IHAAESKAEVEFVRNNTGDFADSFRRRGLAWQAQNRSVISYLESTGILKSRPLLIHVVQADLEDYNLIAESGSSIAHCPKSNAKLGHGRADLSAILRAGIRVGIGTDSVASNNTCDLIDEARFCSLIHSAAECDPQKWSAKRMIEMMTIRGAEALGMQDKIGTLEPGKEADLVVIPLNAAHLSPVNDIEATILFSARGQDVKMTVVSGKEIFSDDSIRTVDERELFEIF
ncbi:MAG: amidohydrolase family protein, partial [Blastocatellia bacterium]|nr:amidohydrolase family protein [Blastocatellia bacterium]